jgi:hypothetical protein
MRKEPPEGISEVKPRVIMAPRDVNGRNSTIFDVSQA